MSEALRIECPKVLSRSRQQYRGLSQRMRKPDLIEDIRVTIRHLPNDDIGRAYQVVNLGHDETGRVYHVRSKAVPSECAARRENPRGPDLLGPRRKWHYSKSRSSIHSNFVILAELHPTR